MNILLIDDEKPTCDSISMFLGELGHSVECAYDGREGLDLFDRHDFQLVFTDINMPKMDGFEFLRQMKKDDRRMVDVVIITGNSDVDSAITALREGAYDYLQKPINIDELSIIVDRVSEHLSLKKTTAELTTRFEEKVREQVTEKEEELERFRKAFRENMGLQKLFIYSKKLGDLYALAEKFHNSPSVPVLIEGETGTGKELLARYVHHGPELVSKPFIAINCAAIPRDLFESELFGHESGAFTGSSSRTKKGQLEAAEDGTVLLDEIGDMPISMQVKLLRVLEEREFYRVGGVKRIPFHARIIASTNKSLKSEVAEGTFRRDLYHRLNVGFLRIPPLRERREEIIPLAYAFLEKACDRHGKRGFTGFSESAESFLESFSWSGNVRQLENAIERVVLLHDGPKVEKEHLRFLEGDEEGGFDVVPPACTAGGTLLDVRGLIPEEGIDMDELITRLVEEAMEMTGGNKAMAAKLLNISPRTISRRLEKSE